MDVLRAAEMEEKCKETWTAFAKGYKIFIDTCSLLSPAADKFWERMIPVLQEVGTDIVVPRRVCEEVEKFAADPALCLQKSPNNPELNRLAVAAKQRLLRLKADQLIRILGDDTDNFADNVFQTVFTQYRLKYNLLLITQDRKLSNDILRIAESESSKTTKKIEVRKIDTHGYLSHIKATEKGPNKNTGKPAATRTYTAKKEESVVVPADEIFAHADTVIVPTGKLTVTQYPAAGDTVLAERRGSQQSIRLGTALSSGGEGTIYETDITDFVAKIYKPGKADVAKFEKLKLMLSKELCCENVCFPVALLYNSRHEFVGYLMRKAKGRELQICVFQPQLLKKYFPQWKKKDTVQLCITILKKLKYLHDRNIILGDINPKNILVVSPTEVYFVDTDSYQIEGYPCPMGTINYTAPEIQRKKFDSFLRTMGNEQFAVATLLFMIMLPGKPPYSLKGGENQIDNIINGDFAYASGERTNGKVPEGLWRYIWSHLPRYLKDDFYETFKKGGEHSTETTRYTDDDWLYKFERYAELLAKEGEGLLANDSMSGELFPTRLKRMSNVTYVHCKLCKREVDEEQTEQGYCRSCLRDGEKYQCARCGCDMVYSNYQKLIRHIRRYEVCKACNDQLNTVYRRYPCACCGNMIEVTHRIKESLEEKGKPLPTLHMTCRDKVYKRMICAACGKSFEITYGEKESYDNKGFELPKKCPDCRGKKTPYTSSSTAQRNSGSGYTSPSRTYSSQTSNSSTNNSYTNNSSTGSSGTNSGDNDSGWCFITTAVCQYFDKPDDCYELTLLRHFRDTWLAKQADGKAWIREYYRVAPTIVAAIDDRDDKDAVYMHIWQDYILPCIKLIELTAYAACKELYMQMVNELKEAYC